jgi:hypothetical protein
MLFILSLRWHMLPSKTFLIKNMKRYCVCYCSILVLGGFWHAHGFHCYIAAVMTLEHWILLVGGLLGGWVAGCWNREEVSRLKEEKSHQASRLGFEPTPAYQLRAPPSVSSQGSATSPPSLIHSTAGPAISSWLQSLIPSSTGIADTGSEASPSRAPSVKSDAGSHSSNKGDQGAASLTAQHNWFQGILPQANTAEQPLAMPWGNFLWKSKLIKNLRLLR